MLKGKFESLVCMLLIIGTLFAGCNNKQPGSGNISSTSLTIENPKPVTLKFLGFKTGGELGAVPEILDEFEKRNSGIKIDYEAIPSTAGYDDSLKARLAAGENLDVFMSHWTYTKDFAEMGYIEDFANEPWVDKISDLLIPLISYKGKVYSFPIEISGIGMYANLDILSRHGIQVPENWNELVAACEKLKNVHEVPFVMGNKSGYSAALMLRGGEMYYADVRENLGQDIVAGRVKSSEVVLPVIKKYEHMVKNKYFDGKASLGMEQGDVALAEFVKGNGAFFLGGSWDLTKMRELDRDFNTMFCPMPMQDSGMAKATIFPGVMLFASSTSKNRELVKNFIGFWSDDHVLSRYVKSQNAYTPLKGGSGTDEPELKLFTDAFKSRHTMLFDVLGIDEFGDWQELKNAGQSIILGKSAADVCKEIDMQVEKTVALKRK